MLLFASQFKVLYPNLAAFDKEKSWRCGKGFISYRAKCYRNPKTGKIAYKTITNPKTGRKNKVKVGLSFTEYQKARKQAVKKQGRGDRLTQLEQKYISDTKRLAASTRKKKQRRADAKEKRRAGKRSLQQQNLKKAKANWGEYKRSQTTKPEGAGSLLKNNINDDKGFKFKEFKKPQSIESINNNLQGYGYQRGGDLAKVADQKLVQEWQYASLANAALRYPKKFPQPKSQVAKQRIGQLGNDSYRTKLAEILADRGLMEQADKSFAISFISNSQSKTSTEDLRTGTSAPLIENYQGFIDTYKRIQSGEITAAEIKQASLELQNNEDAVKADLRKLKKTQLLRMAGWGSRSSDKKERLVNNSFDSLQQDLLPPGSATLSYAISSNPETNRKNRNDAINKKVELWTDELIKEKAVQRQKAIAERDKAVSDPKTIEDYRTLIRYKGRDGLTVAQRAKYEDMVTLKNREERGKKAPKAQAVELPANKTFKLTQTKHTKKGHDLYVASLTERVDRDKYNQLNQRAKTLGGYYSRYARDGAIPGFQFRDEESARKFMGLEEVEGSDRGASKTTNSLRNNAEKLIERNEDKLNQGIFGNTSRRAKIAANTRDSAQAEIAIGKTMLRIADAKEEGTIQFLDRVKAGTEVRQLNSILTTSRYRAARAIADKEHPREDGRNNYNNKQRYDKELDKPITDDTIEYAEYPYPNVHKDSLRKILSEARGQKGLTLTASRLEKKYKAIANKDYQYEVEFKSDKDIADLRKLIDKGAYLDSAYQKDNIKESLKDYDRIHATLDLKTPYELRAALREFNRLRSQKASEDPIKAKELALVGRKIPGFFPTPKPIVDKMIEVAKLKPGERVLESSAGKGNIAEAVREKIGNDTLNTIEIDPDLSAILDEKGFNNRRDDFLNITGEEYDVIIQNPPFEKLADTEHIRKAYELLAPGGRLISLASESPFFQQQKKAREFREWLADIDGYSEKLPAGSFKNSERSTGVNTRLVVIEKPWSEDKAVNYSSESSLNLLLFAKKCGKGYISDNETCYTDIQGKSSYAYKINPKTGRRVKVRQKVSSRRKSKPTLQTRIKRALKDPNSFLSSIKENISNVWQDIGDLIYNDPGKYKLRKPERSSTSRTFRKPNITTAREKLVSQAIASYPPQPVPLDLKQNLTENQQVDVGMAVGAMERDGGFLLAGGTGTGKTRTQLATAKIFADKGKKVLIVSKSEVLKPKWQGKNKGVAGSFKDDAIALGINPKLTKTGKEIKSGEIGLSTYSNLDKLKYAVDKDTVLLFDEAHAFKNADSARAKHGMDMMQKAHSVLYATATPADKPGHLDYLERANVFNGNSKQEIYNWLGLESYSVKQGNKYVQRYRAKKGVKAEDITMRLNGLFDQMTENGNTIKREISLEGVEVGFAEINVSRDTRNKMRSIAQAYKNSPSPLAKAQVLMQQRRQLEADKVPAAVELVEDAIARGRKPIVFVSRVNESTAKAGKNGEDSITSEGTAKLLKQELAKKGIKNISEIHGAATGKPARAMEDFQSGKNDVVIATIESGGTGINLDDRDGDKPRSLIILTPPFSAVENVQAAGRVWRLKTKSYPEIDYVFSNTKTDDWNRRIISNKMQSLGAIVRGETKKLSVEEKRTLDKLSGKTAPRPPKPKRKRRQNYSRFRGDRVLKFGKSRPILELLVSDSR